MNYKSFLNISCEFYPCHDVEYLQNCMFCWCPLYLLDCHGDYIMLNGIKDCSHCLLPHIEGGYEYVLETIRAQVFSNHKKRPRQSNKVKMAIGQLRLLW